jgi:hypothetical protein
VRFRTRQAARSSSLSGIFNGFPISIPPGNHYRE